jgi:hypothetical protein
MLQELHKRTCTVPFRTPRFSVRSAIIVFATHNQQFQMSMALYTNSQHLLSPAQRDTSAFLFVLTSVCSLYVSQKELWDV